MSEPTTNWSWITDSRIWAVGAAVIGWFTATATFRATAAARTDAIEHEVAEHIKQHGEHVARHNTAMEGLSKQIKSVAMTVEDVRRDMSKIEIKVDHLADKDRYSEHAQIMAEANMKAMLKYMHENNIPVTKHDD